MGLTQELCTLIHATSYESLGAECIHRVKQAIKDGVAVALAGSREPVVTSMTAHMVALGGAAQASVWGAGTKVPLTQAAYINSVATHVLDFEPMWSPPTHSVSPTVPVAFALARAQGLSGILSKDNGEQLLERLDRLDALDPDAVQSLVALLAWES